MNKHAIIRLLEHVNHFHLFIELERIKKDILYQAKLYRKDLSKEEIIRKGLNIYPKTGITIDSLIEEAIKNNYIEFKQNHKEEVRITPKGVDCLMELYTDNYCDSFVTFKDEVNDLTKKRNETDFDPVHVAGMFYHNRSLQEIENIYFTDKTLQEEVHAYHTDSLSLYGLKPNDNSFMFHLTPKIFLSWDDMWEDIELSIEGVELPEPLILGRPYPNQRYVEAGTKIGKEKFFAGFYPIIASKQNFPKEKEIRYHWKLGNGKEIIHDIHIEFQVDRGNLFSTEQSISRSNNLPNIRVATFYEDVSLLKNERSIEYSYKNNRVLHMKEKVVLSSFPMHLHSCFWANKSFEKWREKRRE